MTKTSLELKSILRGYGLPVGGSLEELKARVNLLFDLRRTYAEMQESGEQSFGSIRKDAAKAMLDALGVKAWKLSSREAMIARLVSLASRPEPTPETAAKKRATYSVVWLNPATQTMEVYESGLSLAAANRIESSAADQFSALSASASKYLGDDREVSFSVRREPHSYPKYDTSREATAAMEAWVELAKSERAAFGPSISGDLAGMAKAAGSIRASLERLKAERLLLREKRSETRDNPSRRRAR